MNKFKAFIVLLMGINSGMQITSNIREQQELQKQKDDFAAKQKEVEEKETQQKQQEQNQLVAIELKGYTERLKTQRLAKEAESKTAARAELDQIYPFITTIEETNAELTQPDFEHISEYVLKMKTSIDIVLANFRSDTRHFLS